MVIVHFHAQPMLQYQRERESGIVGANSVRLERLMQETAELPLHKDTEAETESEKEGGSQRERERVRCCVETRESYV